MIHVQIKSEQKFTLYKCSCHKPGSDVPKNIAVRDIRGFTVLNNYKQSKLFKLQSK